MSRDELKVFYSVILVHLSPPFFFFLWKNTSSSQIVVVSESWVWTSNYVQLFKFKKCRYFILSFGYWILHLPFYLCLKYIGIQFLNNSLNFFRLCSDISCPFFHSFFFFLSLWKKSESVNCSVVTLCDPVECSPTGSSGHGILQARILEWVAIPFSRWSPWPRDLPDPGIKPRYPAL